MFENILAFFERHQSFILTTHDSPDADGLGAEYVLASILIKKGKNIKIINSSPVPINLQFLINPAFEITKWDISMLASAEHAALLESSAMIVLDTTQEIHLGPVREDLKKVKEVFYFDHHEPKSSVNKLAGIMDAAASSVSELAIELAAFLKIDLDHSTATAAYCGIIYDTGFFSYPKTTERTFKAAIKTLEWGANPHHVYKQLMENSTCAAVLLQKQALANLEFFADRKIAVMFLHNEDFEKAGAEFEEVENIVNIPLKAKEVEISILVREKSTGEVFCSLRSKGTVNVSKIAQNFNGGGHFTASGFMSKDNVETTIKKLLAYMETRVKLGKK